MEKENRIKALFGTILIIGLLFVLLFTLGLHYPVPPPPEMGVEVNLGNSEDGMGTIQPEISESPEAVAPQHRASNEEQISTQSTEESVAMPNRKPARKPLKNNQPQQEQMREEPQPEQPTINPNALYPGKRTANASGSEGITGKPGDQGVPGGTPGSPNYSGTPGSGGGVSFSLQGRSSKSLAKPVYNSDEQGAVVVKIWVDPGGQVVRAKAGEKGTTTADPSLWQQAEQAALRSKFSDKSDAPETQVGTITYKFVRLN